MSAGGPGRLTGAGIEPAGALLRIRFDGRPVDAREGDSVAAALTAAGVLDLHERGSGDRRGIFCGMGTSALPERPGLTPLLDAATYVGSAAQERRGGLGGETEVIHWHSVCFSLLERGEHPFP